MNWTKNKYAVLASTVAAALCALLAGTGYSQTGAASATGSGTPSASAAMSEAEVRKVDTESRKITLKHGEIKNLDMPAMTMTFNVRDAALIDKLVAGDRIRFHAEKDKGSYWVTAVERLR